VKVIKNDPIRVCENNFIKGLKEKLKKSNEEVEYYKKLIQKGKYQIYITSLFRRYFI